MRLPKALKQTKIEKFNSNSWIRAIGPVFQKVAKSNYARSRQLLNFSSNLKMFYLQTLLK